MIDIKDAIIADAGKNERMLRTFFVKNSAMAALFIFLTVIY